MRSKLKGFHDIDCGINMNKYLSRAQYTRIAIDRNRSISSHGIQPHGDKRAVECQVSSCTKLSKASDQGTLIVLQVECREYNPVEPLLSGIILDGILLPVVPNTENS